MSQHAIYYDEDESTEYSEFCDDDTIWAAQATQEATLDPTDSFPSTSLGKRKAPEDSEPSGSLSASYKRQPISSDGAEPYIIVGFVKRFPSVPKARPLWQAHNTSVQRAMDARGLPWGVQWEIARLVSLGHCTWHDISMSGLDLLRTEGLSPSDPDSSAKPVLCAPIAPYVEDLFRWNKNSVGHQRPSKEIQATVSYYFSCNLIINYL